jgi:hypothetical protein
MNVDALVALARSTPPQLSRRQFGLGLAGTTALGGAFASGLLKPAGRGGFARAGPDPRRLAPASVHENARLQTIRPK